VLSPFQRQFLGRTLIGEASNQGDDGMMAVAWALRNRLDSGRWGLNIAGVAGWGAAFSCWNGLLTGKDGKPHNNLDRMRILCLDDNDPALLHAIELMEICLASDPSADPIEGGTFYYDVRTPKPSWAAPPAVLTRQIGVHSFYKNVP